MEEQNIRSKRQREFAHEYVNSDRCSILHVAPRVGKSRIGVFIFEALHVQNILIAYPDEKIKKSWQDEFIECGYDERKVTFTTFLSLKKHVSEKYDMIVIDELHLLSEAQIGACQELFKFNDYKNILGLSGTLSKETKNLLLQSLQLPVLVNYSIERAVEEGIVVDYEIFVITVPLDRKMKTYKGKTEKQKFDNVSWVIDKFQAEGKETFFLRLQRMRIIQNSVAKKNKTISLLKEYEKERVLVFTGLTKIADSLGIASYHSKSTEKKLFEDFVRGDVKHMAVCKIGNSGITFQSLERVILNFFDSNSEKMAQKLNRCMSLEYDNPEKIAKITIISSDEKIELEWLKKSLSMFNKEKIKYI